MVNIRLLIIALLASLAMPLASGAAPDGFLYKKGKSYFFEGHGKPKPEDSNKTQRMSLAREASIVDGKAKIALYIDGLKTKEGLIGDLKQKDEAIKAKVSMILDGVMIVKSQWDDQDNCRTVLKINRKAVLKALRAKEAP